MIYIYILTDLHWLTANTHLIYWNPQTPSVDTWYLHLKPGTWMSEAGLSFIRWCKLGMSAVMQCRKNRVCNVFKAHGPPLVYRAEPSSSSPRTCPIFFYVLRHVTHKYFICTDLYMYLVWHTIFCCEKLYIFFKYKTINLVMYKTIIKLRS